jgi:hypothetical protein
MPSSHDRATLLAIATLFVTSSCGGYTGLPSNGSGNSALQIPHARFPSGAPADRTSILKGLKKEVVIGSTVDPGNGDRAPRAVSIVSASKGVLKAGQLLVCNFDDKAGTAGNGTTIEVLDARPGSKPARFVQSSSAKGCDGDAFTHSFDIFGAGLTAPAVVEFSSKGKILKTYSGSLFKAPFSDTFATAHGTLAPAYLFSSDAQAGSIVSISEGFYGNGEALQVAEGFAVNKAGPASALGPSGLQYSKSLDTLYIVDGVTNTVVAFEHASNLLEPDEIVVNANGKTFKCKHKAVTCGELVYAGSPLNAPIASALLPNGNLVIANTAGKANTLVELTPTGQVLDTKVVDKSSAQGVFGLTAVGTTDSNTALFFTDTNDNSVHELER